MIQNIQQALEAHLFDVNHLRTGKYSETGRFPHNDSIPLSSSLSHSPYPLSSLPLFYRPPTFVKICLISLTVLSTSISLLNFLHKFTNVIIKNM